MHGMCSVYSDFSASKSNITVLPVALKDPPLICSRVCAKSFLTEYAHVHGSPSLAESLAAVAEGLVVDTSGHNTPMTASTSALWTVARKVLFN